MANVSELVFRVLADTKSLAPSLAPATKGLKDLESGAKQADIAIDKLDANSVTLNVNDQAIATARRRIEVLKAEMREGIRVGADTSVAQREIAALTRQIRVLDTTPARVKVDVVGTGKAKADLADIRNEMTGLVGLTPGLMKMAPLIASIGVAALSIRAGAGNESLAASFDIVTKSAEKTALIMDEIDRIGTTRPFKMEDLEKAGLALARFNVDADAIPGLLEDLGTIALTSGKSVEELTRNVAALTVTGAQQARGLRTLEKEGVNAYEALAAATGLTVEETQKLAKEGKFTQDQILGMVRVLGQWNDEAADRTSETFAGQLQIAGNRAGELAEGLGDKLLPAAKVVLSVLSGVVGIVEKIPSGVIAVGAGIGIFVGASKLMGLAVDGLVVKFASLRASMLAAEGGMVGFGIAARGIMGALGGPWGIAITGAITLLGLFATAQSDAAEETTDLAKAVDLQEGAFDRSNREAVARMLVQRDLSKYAEQLGVSTADVTTALLGNDEAFRNFDTNLIRTRQNAGYTSDAHTGLSKGINAIRKELVGASVEQQNFNTAVGATAFDTAGEDAEDYADALKDIKAAAADAATAVDGMFDVLFGQRKGAFELETEVDEFFRGFNDAVKENKDASEGARLANRKLISEGVDLAKQAREQAISEGKSIGEANAAYDAKIEKLRTVAGKQGILTDEISTYINTVDTIPEEVTTEVKATLDADSTGFVALELAKLGYDVLPYVKPSWLQNQEVVDGLAALGIDITPAVKPYLPKPGSAEDKEFRGLLDEYTKDPGGGDARTVTYTPEVKPAAAQAADAELDKIKYETGTVPRQAQVTVQIEKLSLQIALNTLDALTKQRSVTIVPKVSGTVTLPGATSTPTPTPTPGGTRVGSTRVYLDSAPIRAALRPDVETLAARAALTANTARRL